MLTQNTVLQNRYLILQLLARGGMGAVYVARDQRLGSSVALKETLYTDTVMRRAFEQEARLLANLRHPSLPIVTDHFLEGDGQFLVMELISGDDLEQILTRRGTAFPLAEVLSWGDQLLEALEYLHTQQPPVIHRDIKPQNLKLTQTNRIVLLDFGLAKGAPGTAMNSVPAATLAYAPPEQLLHRGTDVRADLYSLAATLYHLLAGRIPANALERLDAKSRGLPDPLRPVTEVNSQVPADISGALMMAMSLYPEQRFSSATAMRQALRVTADQATRSFGQGTVPKAASGFTAPENHSTAGRAPTSSPSSPVRETPRSRRTLVFLGAGALAVTLVAILALLIFRFTQAPKPPRPIIQTPPMIAFRGEPNEAGSNPKGGASPAKVKEALATTRSQPTDAKAKNDAAVAVDSTGDHGQAQTLIAAAAQLAPLDAIIAYNYARILYALGRIDEALSKLQEALRLQPQFVEGDVLQSIIYIDKGDYDAAEAAAQKARSDDPKRTEVYNVLGIILLQRGQVSEAISAFQQAVNLDPNSGVAAYNLGVAYQTNDEKDKAAQYYQVALAKDPGLKEAESNLGTIGSPGPAPPASPVEQPATTTLAGTWTYSCGKESRGQARFEATDATHYRGYDVAAKGVVLMITKTGPNTYDGEYYGIQYRFEVEGDTARITAGGKGLSTTTCTMHR